MPLVHDAPDSAGENGLPPLGTWQGVYFCESDGPRERRYHIKVIAG